MKVLVTGSAGHLGEALMRALADSRQHTAIGVDIRKTDFTHKVGSIADREFVREVMADGVDVVMHTATLHKPHVQTHSRQNFVDTNITGTLNLLEEAVQARVKAFIFTSTTSVFGYAMTSTGGEASWITEEVTPRPKNIYGVTKLAAENLCELMHQLHGLPVIVLRTSRFFPEQDDLERFRLAMVDQNLKANEFLYRRVDIQDVVQAHLRAMEMAHEICFDKFIISATTPFCPEDAQDLTTDAPSVVARLYPNRQTTIYDKLEWKMFTTLDRVYDNTRARTKLGWKPRYDFAHWLQCLEQGNDDNSDPWSPMTRLVGNKGYHPTGNTTSRLDEPFPADQEQEHGPSI